MPSKLEATMGRKQTHDIRLSEEERVGLINNTKKGTLTPRQIKRVQILLKADKNGPNPKEDWEIAEELHCNRCTVTNLRYRFSKIRLGVVTDLERSGRPKIVDGDAEAHIIAIACSQAPEGRQRWTLRLIAGKVVSLKEMEACSYGTVRNVLKKTSLNLGRKKSGKSHQKQMMNLSGRWKKS